MARISVVLAVLFPIGCGDSGGATDATEEDDGAPTEVGADGDADTTDDGFDPLACPFSAPVALAELNTPEVEAAPDISSDGLTLFFTRADDLWLAARPATDAVFAPVRALDELNTGEPEGDPSISADGLTLYFRRTWTLYSASRPTVSDPFGAAVPVAEINADGDVGGPDISTDGLSLYFASRRAGGAGDWDLWYATRSDAGSPFDPPQNLTPLNTSDAEASPAISADGRVLYFSRDVVAALRRYDLWVASRRLATEPFGSPSALVELNSTGNDSGETITPDGLSLIFHSDREAFSYDLWQSTRTCP